MTPIRRLNFKVHQAKLHDCSHAVRNLDSYRLWWVLVLYGIMGELCEANCKKNGSWKSCNYLRFFQTHLTKMTKKWLFAGQYLGTHIQLRTKNHTYVTYSASWIELSYLFIDVMSQKKVEIFRCHLKKFLWKKPFPNKKPQTFFWGAKKPVIGPYLLDLLPFWTLFKKNSRTRCALQDLNHFPCWCVHGQPKISKQFHEKWMKKFDDVIFFLVAIISKLFHDWSLKRL